jgi:hypothetical protein
MTYMLKLVLCIKCQSIHFLGFSTLILILKVQGVEKCSFKPIASIKSTSWDTAEALLVWESTDQNQDNAFRQNRITVCGETILSVFSLPATTLIGSPSTYYFLSQIHLSNGRFLTTSQWYSEAQPVVKHGELSTISFCMSLIFIVLEFANEFCSDECFNLFVGKPWSN